MSPAVRAKAVVTMLKAGLTAGLAAGLLSGCTGTQADAGPDGSENRFIAGDGSAQVVQAADREGTPEVSGTTLEDEPLKLSGLRGKVVVVNFWASWCAPCRDEAPTLQRLYTAYKPKGVEFVGIDIKDSKDSAKAMERNFKITYPSLFDSDGRLALAFRDVPPNAIPSTLILDRQGRVAVRIIGPITHSKLDPLLARLAAER
jgi:thiol-disulfide isomerase/thioredoxin